MKNNRNERYTYLMALGHLFSDLNQGAVAALLPFLIEKNHFDYAIAAGLVFAMNLVSSIIQPFFGYVSDKYNSTWVLPAAILLAGSGFSFLGIADSYAYLIVGVVICGIGIAAYHPGGAKLTNALVVPKILWKLL